MKTSRIVILSLVLVIGIATPHARSFGGRMEEARRNPATSTRSDDANWLASVRANLARAEYEISATPAGLQAPNRARDLRTFFREDRVEVVRRTEPRAAWRWTWRTTAWGREGAMAAPGAGAPRHDGARVEYARGGLVEWYENRPEGLEQGFTITARPSGDGPLCLEGTLVDASDARAGAALGARLSSDARSVDFFDAAGTVALRYGGLVARDARGRDLDARLALEGDRVGILVDDRAAAYPILIDPLLTTPSWTLEGGVGNTQFAFSVATAGDVNGDGYSDVIVGALDYDNGQTDEGRAFVYHGSAGGPPATPSWTAEVDLAGAFFGVSVATAGDVNGDGYDDVIVGAYQYTNGQSEEGRAYVWYGGASGLGADGNDANFDWKAEGDQANADLGTSVATAGDVNNDGYDDVIVGAPAYDDGQSNEGAAFVFLGSATGLGVNGTPSNADWICKSDQISAGLGRSVATAGDVNADTYDDVIVGANVYDGMGKAFVWFGSAADLGADGTPLNADWTEDPGVPGSYFGFSVSTAGDVNGDGYSDVVVGAPDYTFPLASEGAAFVYLGQSTGLSTSASIRKGGQAGARSGYSVGTAGDVNGDGFADVIVGAVLYTNGESSEGRAIVFMGSASGIPTQPSWTFEGNQVDADLGLSVGTAGDVDGDGYGDVIVGAPFYDAADNNDGAAFLFRGSPAGLSLSAAHTLEENGPGALLGSSVASAGDVNGDGYGDVIVGAPQFDDGAIEEGRVFVYLGSPTGLPATASWSAEGNQADSHLGQSVAAAGDVNGDGFDDVIVGALLYDSGQTDEGRVFVWHGSGTGLGPNGTPVNADWSAEGNITGGAFGNSVATAGDVNADGYQDVVIGSRFFTRGQTHEGRAHLYLGGLSGLASTSIWTFEANQDSAQVGFSVASAGDVNGDGFSDVIVGAPYYDNGTFMDQGRAWVFHGYPSGLPPTANWELSTGYTLNAQFGFSVSTAGDVNGDGYSDVIVGAPYDTNGEVAEGRARVFLGLGSGLSMTPAWTTEADAGFVNLGYSVSTAGDVNGDGYSDVLIGVPNYAAGQALEGEALLFVGSASGLGPDSAWTAQANQATAYMGYSVAAAGDVNGDGYSDVIVGAPYFDNGETEEGRATVYYGNDVDGLDRIPRQRRVADTAPIANLGRSESETSFRLRMSGRTSAGRGRVQLEWEVKPLGTAFDGTGLGTSGVFTTGAPLVGAGSQFPLTGTPSGLTSWTPYHWRARVLTDSPFFPRSPWFSPAYNAPSETDLKTTSTLVGVPGSATPSAPPAVGILSNHPDPFAERTTLSFRIAASGRVRLAIYDVAGRHLATLVDGAREAGEHRVVWDGRDGRGRPAAAGVYFSRLESDRLVSTRRLVLVR